MMLRSQDLSGLSARWSDSFVEWDLYGFDGEDAQEERIGHLQLRWLNLKDDFSEWEYQCGSQRGSIRLKWKDDPNNWELRTFDNETITMRTLFNGDLRQWRVTNNDYSLELRSKWQNQLDEWLVEDRARGIFYIYTARERDPRDWLIDDRLSDEVSPAMRMALAFLAVFHGSPKM
ncbi:MAG: hypothetical protein ACK4NS_01640 [Saprospiraceae bacterium]